MLIEVTCVIIFVLTFFCNHTTQYHNKMIPKLWYFTRTKCVVIDLQIGRFIIQHMKHSLKICGILFSFFKNYEKNHKYNGTIELLHMYFTNNLTMCILMSVLIREISYYQCIYIFLRNWVICFLVNFLVLQTCKKRLLWSKMKTNEHSCASLF